MLAHYSSDTFSTRIEYLSADPYSTYTIYNPADVRSDVLNDIMSSYYLHIYRILGLNGVMKPNVPCPSEALGKVFTEYLHGLPASMHAICGTILDQPWSHSGRTGVIGVVFCLY